MKLNVQKATEIAIESALQSEEKHCVGAILFCGNQYVTGFNRTFSVRVQNRPTAWSDHAESIVINHAIHLGFDLTKSTLIVVRINNKGSLMLAKPCKNCRVLIQKMGIPRVYYSNDPLRRSLISQNFKSIGE